MSITLTEEAAAQIKKQLSKRGSGIGLKLGVKKSGCSGYAYTLDYADSLNTDDAGTLTGVVNGDNITAGYSTTGSSTSPVGTYPITATLTGVPASVLNNYTITNTPGVLTITSAAGAISVVTSRPT